MLKNIKKVIIFTSIFIIICAILLIIVLKGNIKEGTENIEEQNIANVYDGKFSEVENYDLYFAAQRIIYMYIANLKNVGYQDIEDIVNNINKMTNQNYTSEEIINIAKEYPVDKNDGFIIENMYYNEKNFDIIVVYVECKIAGVETKIAIKFDYKNLTYILYANDYIDKFENSGKLLESIDDLAIEENDYNKFALNNITNEYVATTYARQYLKDMLNDTERAYSLLDEDYRNKRFGNMDNFEKYISDNKDEFENIEIKQFLVNSYTDYREYVCKDQYENLYIFKETAIMKYTVSLDTYTIEQEKFKTTYNSANDEKKVAMNVDKFIQMLNRRDYKTAYNLLDEGFRNNYFKTQSDFEKYIKEKYPLHYKVKYTTFSDQGGIYVQTINLTDITEESEDIKSMSIIMKLGEGTNFVMSYDKQ